MKTILAPIDFSEASARVIDEAARLAQMSDARVVLLHVVKPIQAAVGYDMDAQHLSAVNAGMEREADRRLADAKSALQRRGVSTDTLRLTGQPAKDIIDQAGELRASYIVMGANGHEAFDDLVTGSTANVAVKRAPCPVLVVPGVRAAVALSGAV